jgi:predicted O-methyltransferase YrrM
MAKTFPDGHFYSPIPNVDGLDPSRFADAFSHVLSLSEKAVLPFAGEVYSYGKEFSSRVDSGASGFKWSNSQFPPADALAYYGVLRTAKPNRILEIGAGSSTRVAIEAVKKNGHGHVTCVEPYPEDFLKSNKEITLIERKLQDVPDDIFKSLRRGDVLFVDSTHQAKCQSDVLDIFFRVLDLLEVGVLIHFHDIFIPDDYPYFWLKERGVYFNEQYFLLAFLKDNAKYGCRLPNAFIVRKHRDAYEGWVSGIHQPTNESFVNLEHEYIKGGSFWIEKLSR